PPDPGAAHRGIAGADRRGRLHRAVGGGEGRAAPAPCRPPVGRGHAPGGARVKLPILRTPERPMRSPVLAFAFAALVVLPAALAPAQEPAARQQAGNRVTENMPEIPAELIERLNRYQNT